MTFERATELMESKTPVFTFLAPVSCCKVMLGKVNRDAADVNTLIQLADGNESIAIMSRWLDDVFETPQEALQHQIEKAQIDVERERNEVEWHKHELDFHERTLNMLRVMQTEG